MQCESIPKVLGRVGGVHFPIPCREILGWTRSAESSTRSVQQSALSHVTDFARAIIRLPQSSN
jgi:hypothetical protein